jgi:LacI family transcriptional regulator
MATIKDIARETGLGLATISKYLNGGNVREPNRAAIEQSVEKLGFTVNEFARGLKTSRSRTIGILIPELSNLFITSIITVIEDILRQSGYAAIICDCRTDAAREAEAVRFLLQKRVDGIINMPTTLDGSHLAGVVAQGIPVVLIDRAVAALKGKASMVQVDNVAASAMATQCLVESGHRKIGILLGPQDIFTSQQRLLGYSQALIGNGIMPAPEHIRYTDYTVRGGYEAMKELARGCDITSVFVTNYEMTLGAIIALEETGVQIPDQLSFIGFDNQQLSQIVRPTLTIVTQPLEEMGRAAAEIMLEQIAGGAGRAGETGDAGKAVDTGKAGDAGGPRSVVLPTELRQGKSVKNILN